MFSIWVPMRKGGEDAEEEYQLRFPQPFQHWTLRPVTSTPL